VSKARTKGTQKEVSRLTGEGGSQSAVGAQASARASGDDTSLPRKVKVLIEQEAHELDHGAVVIAAITSCTNTSNPSVMVAAGILAKKAVERGLMTKPWVKTSLAPGSRVVTDYLKDTGLMPYLERLKFHVVAYGCTTC